MIDLLRFVSGLAADLARRRVELVAENALLRQQLIVAKRKLAGRVQWTPWQRFTIVLASRVGRLGVEQPCSSSPRAFFVGIARRRERDRAFEWLERSYALPDVALVDVKSDPLLRNLHGDPRYPALLARALSSRRSLMPAIS